MAFVQLNRRKLLKVIGGVVATCWVTAAAAQQVKVPTVGVLLVESPGSEQFRSQLRQELRKLGYVDGRSIRFEFRSDQGKATRLRALRATTAKNHLRGRRSGGRPRQAQLERILSSSAGLPHRRL
jgi:hypothetical protein